MCQLNQLRRANLKTNEVNLCDACCLYLDCSLFKVIFQPTEPTLAIKFIDAVILSGDCCFKLSMSILIFQLICPFLLNQITNWKFLNRMSYYPVVFVFQIMCQLNQLRKANLKTIEFNLCNACCLYLDGSLFKIVFLSLIHI